jgi:hypothetical protein
MLKSLGWCVLRLGVRSRCCTQGLYCLRQQINGKIGVENHERLTGHCERITFAQAVSCASESDQAGLIPCKRCIAAFGRFLAANTAI